MTEKLIAELIQERKLNAQARFNNTFMSQDASRLLHSAISAVERRNYRKMMIYSQYLNDENAACSAAARRHENAVKSFREAIDSARKEAETVEKKRKEMISTLSSLNKITNARNEEKELKKTDKKKPESPETKENDSTIFSGTLLRKVSNYNMDGDLSLETLQARQDIILRVMGNEDALIKSLILLRERYVENLLGGSCKTVSRGAIQDLFHGQHSILSDLVNTAKSIEDKSIELRDRLRSSTQRPDLKTLTKLSSAVAQDLLDYAPNLAVFARYVSECSDAIDHIDMCINRHSDLARYLELNNTNVFMTLLVAPVVRICSYRDEIDEILHHTSAYHDDFDAWKLVKEAIRISSARIDVNELENIKSQYHLRRLCVLFSKSGPPSFLKSLKEREYQFDKRVVLAASSPSFDRNTIHRLVVFKNSVVLVRVVNTQWQRTIEITDFRIDFDSKGLRIYESSGNGEIAIIETIDDGSPAVLQDTFISEVSELASCLNDIFSDRVVTMTRSNSVLSHQSTGNSTGIEELTEFDTASEEEEEEN